MPVDQLRAAWRAQMNSKHTKEECMLPATRGANATILLQLLALVEVATVHTGKYKTRSVLYIAFHGTLFASYLACA